MDTNEWSWSHFFRGISLSASFAGYSYTPYPFGAMERALTNIWKRIGEDLYASRDNQDDGCNNERDQDLFW